MDILILNGPNLNLLGRREPAVYGDRSFGDYLDELHAAFPDHDLGYAQSNAEGELIERVHEAGFSPGGIVINAGALSHTSLALADALRAVDRPAIGVHITNIFARESFRHTDLVAGACLGTIAGLGLDGYRLAVDHLIRVVGA